MSKVIDPSEVKQHTSDDSAWVVIDGQVFDVTEFLDDHPGGRKILVKNSGKDVSQVFWSYHSEKIFERQASKLKIGQLKEGSKI